MSAAAPSISIRDHSMDEVRLVIADINERNGSVTPEAVVAEAEAEGSPLHRYFEWDDGEAARRFRLVQARALVRTVKLDIIRQVGPKREVTLEIARAYVSPPVIRGAGSYVRLAAAMEDDDMRADMLDRAKRELKGVKDRYRQLTELADVWESIEQL